MLYAEEHGCKLEERCCIPEEYSVILEARGYIPKECGYTGCIKMLGPLCFPQILSFCSTLE